MSELLLLSRDYPKFLSWIRIPVYRDSRFHGQSVTHNQRNNNVYDKELDEMGLDQRQTAGQQTAEQYVVTAG